VRAARVGLSPVSRSPYPPEPVRRLLDFYAQGHTLGLLGMNPNLEINMNDLSWASDHFSQIRAIYAEKKD
jgi:hypothetical protein